MIYFVYKTEEEKLSIEKELKSIAKYIYGDNDLSYIKGRLDTFPFSNLKDNKEALLRFSKNPSGLYMDDNDDYYKCFDNLDGKLSEDVINMMFDGITWCKSGDENAPYLCILGDYVSSTMSYSYQDKYKNLSIAGEIGYLGFLAFTNGNKSKHQNDLVYSSLYDRKHLKKVYEDIMGEGAYDSLDNLCYEIVQNILYSDGVIDNVRFHKVLNTIKDYFYKKIDRALDISEVEKRTLINDFEDEYLSLFNRYEEEMGLKKSRH